jgi:hypothetical protein
MKKAFCAVTSCLKAPDVMFRKKEGIHATRIGAPGHIHTLFKKPSGKKCLRWMYRRQK